MPKVLKNTKKAIQTRNRVRMFRGIQSIMADNSASSLNFKDLKQKLRNQREIPNCDKSAEPPSLSERLKNLSNNLKNWAIEKNINKRAVTELLIILRMAGLNHLPKDSRSLLETPRVVEINECAGGKYWHNGLENCLRTVFANLSTNLCVKLNISIDGLPLFKSSPLTFWPILANVHGR